MDPLPEFNNGDTDYVDRHNSNNALIVAAITTLENEREQVANRGAPNGYASLDADGIVPASQLPPADPLPDQPYDFMTFYSGVPPSGALLARANIPRVVNLPSGLVGSIANSGFAANAETVLTIRLNGDAIGTITFAGSSNTGAFAFASDVEIGVGDLLTIVNDAEADLTLADISITLVGTRSAS